jgi:putative transposase
VASRVSPTEAIRAQIHELFGAGADGNLLGAIEQVARLSVRLTFQSVIEEIVCEELGRGRYERRLVTEPDDLPPAYRNGWQKPRSLKTALGPVQVQRPKLRHAHAALCDQLFGREVTRTNALETFVISCWVRGLSDRDVEAMLAELSGEARRSAEPQSAGSASGCAPSSRRGGAAAWPGPGSTTCSWMGRSSRCTPRPGPSRCWWPGASTPTATRCSWAWRPARPSPPTPGAPCSTISKTAAWAPRCWSSPTAAAACARRSSARSRLACTKGAWCMAIVRK